MSKRLLPCNEDIKDDAKEYATGYAPCRNNYTPQEYVQHGFEAGMKQLRDELEDTFIARGIN